MRIVFLAYRSWALEVYPSLVKHVKVTKSELCTSEDDLRGLDLNLFDLLITCGWSDELPKDVTETIECIGVHCAELDRYSYGSPLQLQIIDGIRRTKHRVFSFVSDLSSSRAHTHNRLYSHEVDLDLSGSMSEIFQQMTTTSKALFNFFLDDYPQINWMEWPEERTIRNKRHPLDSRLTKEQFNVMTTEELYNFFRCLEAPYPNGYIEDETGKLFITSVTFKKK